MLNCSSWHSNSAASKTTLLKLSLWSTWSRWSLSNSPQWVISSDCTTWSTCYSKMKTSSHLNSRSTKTSVFDNSLATHCSRSWSCVQLNWLASRIDWLAYACWIRSQKPNKLWRLSLIYRWASYSRASLSDSLHQLKTLKTLNISSSTSSEPMVPLNAALKSSLPCSIDTEKKATGRNSPSFLLSLTS